MNGMRYLSGRYNLNFDISALLLTVFLLVYYLVRPRVYQERRAKIFLLLLGNLLISASSELAAGILMNQELPEMDPVLNAVRVILHISQLSLPYLLVIYLMEVLGFSRSYAYREYALIAIPELVMILSFLIPPVRQAFFHSNAAGRGIERTWDVFFFGTVVFFYLVLALVILFRSKRAIRRWTFTQTITLIACFLLSIVLHLADPYLHISIFIESLCMLGMYLTLENNTDLYDAGSGLRTRTALWQESGMLLQLHVFATLISIKLRDAGYLSMVLGVPAVNQLTKEVAIYLQQFAGDDVHVFRLSSQSYALLFLPGKGTNPEQNAVRTGDQILARFQRAWVLSETPVFVGAQVWIGSIPEQLPDEKHVSVFADSCYDPTIPGNSLHRYDMLSSEQRRSEVELALQRALSLDTLSVSYQPICDTKDGKIHSCEALLRMNDPKLGNVSPEEFIKVAEQIGLIGRIGDLVFDKVCTFLESCRPEQYGLDFVEVNLSTIQCMDPTLPMRFQRIMQSHGVKPQQINLEITESAVIHDEKTMLALLSTLQKIGFSFALDDFGTGNANYTYVMKYPFRLIKIDKSFLWGAEKDDAARAILENMLELVRGLGREAVVEGVETNRQREFLYSKKVRYLQGYYYSKPIPEEPFLEYLRRFNEGKIAGGEGC
jgi:EAL domain-containing protein (putative c-di-GMP-specific phosphodiesterase class I)/GGDEF domain-containing protein